MARKRDQDAGVWRAMSEPSRRKILDLLRVRPRTTGQIAAEFSISRIAIMRHLVVLGEAGLVVSRKRGRERWNYLNALPLERIHRRWVGRVDAGWARRLLQLDSRLADQGRLMERVASPLAIDIAQELTFTRPRHEVFAALTSVASWWGTPYVRATATDLRLEPRVGGAFEEVWGSAGGRLLAVVTAFEANRHLELTGPLHLGVVYGVVQFELEDARPGTRLSFSHRGIGSVTDAAAVTFAEGWKELVTVRLVALVERGVKLGIAERSGKRRNGDGK